jgi:cytochrome P450 family 4
MVYQAALFFAASLDTSSNTIISTIYSLSQKHNYRILEKLRTEIDTFFPEIDDLKKFDLEDNVTQILNNMPYLDAVIKESMRLYPVAPFIARRLQDNVVIPKENNDGVMTLPAGSVALVWIYSLHRNPEFWNRPDDFIPERWIDIDLKDPGQSNGAYMPFAAGPRNCLGRPIANIVVRTILARLVYRFKFEDIRLRVPGNADDLRIEMEAGFTVLPAGGVNLEIWDRTIEEGK